MPFPTLFSYFCPFSLKRPFVAADARGSDRFLDCRSMKKKRESSIRFSRLLEPLFCATTVVRVPERCSNSERESRFAEKCQLANEIHIRWIPLRLHWSSAFIRCTLLLFTCLLIKKCYSAGIELTCGSHRRLNSHWSSGNIWEMCRAAFALGNWFLLLPIPPLFCLGTKDFSRLFYFSLQLLIS